MRKRSFTLLVTVEVSHKPSQVVSPSSFWKTQRKCAPSGAGSTERPSPWYCPLTFELSLEKGIAFPVRPYAEMSSARAEVPAQISRFSTNTWKLKIGLPSASTPESKAQFVRRQTYNGAPGVMPHSHGR